MMAKQHFISQKTFLDDQGYYTCTARNSLGTSRTTSRLIIKCKIKVFFFFKLKLIIIEFFQQLMNEYHQHVVNQMTGSAVCFDCSISTTTSTSTTTNK